MPWVNSPSDDIRMGYSPYYGSGRLGWSDGLFAPSNMWRSQQSFNPVGNNGGGGGGMGGDGFPFLQLGPSDVQSPLNQLNAMLRGSLSGGQRNTGMGGGMVNVGSGISQSPVFSPQDQQAVMGRANSVLRSPTVPNSFRGVNVSDRAHDALRLFMGDTARDLASRGATAAGRQMGESNARQSLAQQMAAASMEEGLGRLMVGQQQRAWNNDLRQSGLLMQLLGGLI